MEHNTRTQEEALSPEEAALYNCKDRFTSDQLRAFILRILDDPRVLATVRDDIREESFRTSIPGDPLYEIMKLVMTKIRRKYEVEIHKDTVFTWVQLMPDSLAREAAINEFSVQFKRPEIISWSKTDSAIASFLIFIKYQVIQSGILKAKAELKKTNLLEDLVTGMINTVKRAERVDMPSGEVIDWQEVYKKLEAGDYERTADAFKTGMPGYDREFGGFFPGQLIGFVSSSGGGKSMMTVNLIASCIEQKKGCYAVIAEDSLKTLSTRLLSRMTRIPINSLKKGYQHLDKEAKDRIKNAIPEIEKYTTIILSGDKTLTSYYEDMREDDRKRKNQGKPPITVFILDYLGQIINNTRDKDTPEWQQLKSGCASLKAYALRNDILVFTHFQVNGNGKEKATRMNTSEYFNGSDLGGSKDMENLLDYGFGINPQKDNKGGDHKLINIFKGREGGWGYVYKVDIDFSCATYKFETAERIDTQNGGQPEFNEFKG